MKNLRKISLIVSFILITILITNTTALAAPKLSKSRAKMEVDSVLTLKITGTENKVTWKSSNTKVATVSKTGKVVAIKKGDAVITAIVDKKEYKCEIQVYNSNQKNINENLTSGEYLVGEDIPVGKYNLAAVSGAGMIKIYDNENDYENDDYNYKHITLAPKDSDSYELFPSLYSYEYKNLSLKKGNYIVIDSGLEVNFKTK